MSLHDDEHDEGRSVPTIALSLRDDEHDASNTLHQEIEGKITSLVTNETNRISDFDHSLSINYLLR